MNENHAIAVMAAYIRFADDLPDLLYRKALRALSSVAENLGLTSVGVAQRMVVELGDDGIKPSDKLNQPGQLFTRFVGLEDGESPSFKRLEQIHFDRSSLVYRTWDYVSWEWQSDRIMALFSTVIEHIKDAVLFEAVGMEYLDRFQATDANAPLDQLLQVDSQLVAPHIFSAKNLFHSHSGVLLDDPANPKLQVVKVDAVEESDVRWINIITTQERRYNAEAAENADFAAALNEAHTDLKGLLAKVITAEQAKRIYLKD